MPVVTDDRLGERDVFSRTLVGGDVSNLVDNHLAHDRGREREKLSAILRADLATGQELDEGLIDERCRAAARAVPST